MPIEIRELIIKAIVQEPGADKRPSGTANSQDREEIIADCVEEVMRILRENQER